MHWQYFLKHGESIIARKSSTINLGIWKKTALKIEVKFKVYTGLEKKALKLSDVGENCRIHDVIWRAGENRSFYVLMEDLAQIWLRSKQIPFESMHAFKIPELKRLAINGMPFSLERNRADTHWTWSANAARFLQIFQFSKVSQFDNVTIFLIITER